MAANLFFQDLLQRARPFIGLLFAAALKFTMLLCQVEGRENRDLKGIGSVGLRGEVAHSRVDLFGEPPNLRFR
jgi:hypothetical protein